MNDGANPHGRAATTAVATAAEVAGAAGTEWPASCHSRISVSLFSLFSEIYIKSNFLCNDSAMFVLITRFFLFNGCLIFFSIVG